MAAVEKANEVVGEYVRVEKSMILFTTSEKPFLRAGKGSVQRKLTVDAYKEDLEELYRRNSAGVGL